MTELRNSKKFHSISAAYKATVGQLSVRHNYKQNILSFNNSNSSAIKFSKELPKSTKRFPKAIFIPCFKESINSNSDKIISLKTMNTTINKPMNNFEFIEKSSSNKELGFDFLKEKSEEKMKCLISNSTKLSPLRIGINRKSSNNNQIANLELLSQLHTVHAPIPRSMINISDIHESSSSGIKNPLEQIKTNRQGKIIKFKPIQRTLHSSRGGIIKILLPKDFLIKKTMPSSKEDTKKIASGSNLK